MKQSQFDFVDHQKLLTNKVADFSINLVEDTNKQRVTTIWRKLQETRNKKYLTEKEFSTLQTTVRNFFKTEFHFEPLTVFEIIL